MATLRNYFLAVPGSASRKSRASFEDAEARSARTTNTDPQTDPRWAIYDNALAVADSFHREECVWRHDSDENPERPHDLRTVMG
jgi:hypothetical protein